MLRLVSATRAALIFVQLLGAGASIESFRLSEPSPDVDAPKSSLGSASQPQHTAEPLPASVSAHFPSEKLRAPCEARLPALPFVSLPAPASESCGN